ncbi:hypothetical protein [Catenovulum sediminis]|uniref:hypothetical protein n=1 Tax=Catenovulum sediminis TaxID=1740262 RepID=UPI00163D9430|nr:hypothetical protein [Catenovulum sediminis]
MAGQSTPWRAIWLRNRQRAKPLQHPNDAHAAQFKAIYFVIIQQTENVPDIFWHSLHP